MTDEVERQLRDWAAKLLAELDEADALIMDLTGMPWEAAYPIGSDKTKAIKNWQVRCVVRGSV